MDLRERLKEYTKEGLVKRISCRSRERVFTSENQKGVWVLLSGLAELCMGEGAESRLLDIMLPGDVFGVLSDKVQTKGVYLRAFTPSVFLYTEPESFEKLGTKDPKLVLDVFSALLQKQAMLYEAMSHLSRARARDKIDGFLRFLINLAEERGAEVFVNKRQIASLTGLSYEHVVRTMNSVSLESRRVRIW